MINVTQPPLLQDVVGKSARTIFGNPPVVFHIAIAFFFSFLLIIFIAL